MHVQQAILIFRADEYTCLGASDDMRGIQKEIGMEERIFLFPQSRSPRVIPQTWSHRRSTGLASRVLEAWGQDTISVTLCVARLTVGLVLASVPPGKHPCSLRRCWCSQESAAAGNATIMPTQCKDYKNVGFIFSLFLFTQRSINVPKSGELERNQIIHSVHLLPWWNHVSLDTTPDLSVGPVLPTCSLNGLASLLSSCSTLKVQKQKPVLPWL